MQYIKKGIKQLIIATIAIVFFTACDNDPSSIGLDTLPASDLLEANVSNTKIQGENILPDSIISDGSTRNAAGIIGIINDPNFGWTKAEIVTQINLAKRIESFQENFGEVFADSIVLNLAYRTNDWYGDTISEYTIQVFELSEPLIETSRYYNNQPMEGKHHPEPIAEHTFKANDNQPSSVWENDYIHTLSIPLSKELAERFINFSDKELSDRRAFRQAFNGFYIKVVEPETETTGSLVKINMHNENTNASLHYRHIIYDGENPDKPVLKTDTLTYKFPINTETKFFNRFEHEHQSKITFNEPSTQRLFIQGMAGSFVKFDLTHLFNEWADSLKTADEGLKYGISGVDLVFHLDKDKHEINDEFVTPHNQQIVIRHKNEEGVVHSPVFVNKNAQEALAFHNTIAELNTTENSFMFRMDQEYFLMAAKGEIDIKPLYLSIPSRQFNFRPVILFNEPNHEKGPEIKVKYIKHY